MTAPTPEQVEAALTFVQGLPEVSLNGWGRTVRNMHKFFPGDVNTGDTAARILAAEVERLRSEFAKLHDQNTKP